MRKILLIAIALMAMMGTASAYGTDIFKDGVPISEDNPIELKPGCSIDINYGGNAFSIINVDYLWGYTVTPISDTGATLSQLTVTIPDMATHPFYPTSDPYIDTRPITIALNASTPVGARFIVHIGAGDETAGIAFDTASRDINSVPEFPTIALPVAAILGLAFIFQRRREED